MGMSSSGSNTPGTSLRRWATRLETSWAWLFGLLLIWLYVPSLSGDFLPYDDDWLITNNALLELPLAQALKAVFLDLSLETRLALGAEYLPLRDLSHYIEVTLFGKRVFVMRVVQLSLYLVALGFLYQGLVPCVNVATARVATIVFAVHPVHVESVAWLAGRKDVLALVFVSAALACYVRSGRLRWVAVPLVAAAALSKSMSVITPGLLLAMDLLAKRRPAWGVLGACLTVAGLTFVVHSQVGATVGMVGGPLGQSRALAFWSMGEVWLRYLEVAVWPPACSIVHDVNWVWSPTFTSVMGWGLWGAAGAYGVSRAVKGETFALGVTGWALLPLVPVSQVIFPLQNVMADRYLWLSVLALGLVLGRFWSIRNATKGMFVVAGLGFAIGTLHRAALFGDATAVFLDASTKSSGPRAPYQLGYAYQQLGESTQAIVAYREALTRDCDDCSTKRSARNNLAVLYVAQNELQLAEEVLRGNMAEFPSDPKSAFNLVKVLFRLGKLDEARQLYEEASLRFPDYRSSDTVVR